MMHEHLTGWAALGAAATLFLHAFGTQAPAISRAIVALIEAAQKALTARAASQQLTAEAHARVEIGREDTITHLRGQVDDCVRDRDSLRAEVDTLRTQLAALHEEFAELRRSMTSGHGRT